MKHIVLGLFTSVIVLSCSKSIEAPSAIVEADEKTCACFEPMANSFKEIRDYYIDNYNSWKDSKIKGEFVKLLFKAMKEELAYEKEHHEHYRVRCEAQEKVKS